MTRQQGLRHRRSDYEARQIDEEEDTSHYGESERQGPRQLFEGAGVIAGDGADDVAGGAELGGLRGDRADPHREEELPHLGTREVTGHQRDHQEPRRLLQQLGPGDHDDVGPDLLPIHATASRLLPRIGPVQNSNKSRYSIMFSQKNTSSTKSDSMWNGTITRRKA